MDACELSIYDLCHHDKIWMASVYQDMIILALREYPYSRSAINDLAKFEFMKFKQAYKVTPRLKTMSFNFKLE